MHRPPRPVGARSERAIARRLIRESRGWASDRGTPCSVRWQCPPGAAGGERTSSCIRSEAELVGGVLHSQADFLADVRLAVHDARDPHVRPAVGAGVTTARLRGPEESVEKGRSRSAAAQGLPPAEPLLGVLLVLRHWAVGHRHRAGLHRHDHRGDFVGRYLVLRADVPSRRAPTRSPPGIRARETAHADTAGRSSASSGLSPTKASMSTPTVPKLCGAKRSWTGSITAIPADLTPPAPTSHAFAATPTAPSPT